MISSFSFRLVKSSSHVLLVALGLAPLAAAQVAPHFDHDPAFERREVAESTVAVLFEGFVNEPDGLPAGGAVVVSSAGGQTVTDANGAFRFTIEVPVTAADVQITAVGRTGGDLVASRRVPVSVAPGGVRVEPLSLAKGTQCSPSWLPTFGMAPGVNHEVRAFEVFDDGGGAALYVGGSFWRAGGVSAYGIAKWDGSEWATVGGGVPATIASVYALTVFDDGGGPALYIGGAFAWAGNITAGNIGKWDGSTWEPLDTGITGFNPVVRALTVFDDGSGPALYAGGRFTGAGTEATSSIAKWDGSTWEALGSGIGSSNSTIRALAVFDGGSGAALYAAGGFTSAGGVAANYIAKWDGATWMALGSEVDAPVHALRVFDDGGGSALYAGGRFTSAGGLSASYAASWDGTAWAPLGSGMDGWVHALTVLDDGSGPMLHAGGDFTTASGVTVNKTASWNGSSWSALGSGMGSGDTVRALGAFDSGGGEVLYAGGRITSAGGLLAHHIAEWDGSSWDAFEGGLSDRVSALTVLDDGGGAALYAGGSFTSAGGVAANYIAKWDGSSWATLGSGMDQQVLGLTVFDDGGGPALYAGGTFTSAGGGPASFIAKWDGSAWQALGTGVDAGVNVLTVFDDGGGEALYAGGGFTSAGSVAANRIAKWDGSVWEALGQGVNGGVGALTVFDDGGGGALFAGGAFTSAGSVAANCIAKWDGSAWEALGSGTSKFVAALTVFDDGSGPALYAGGLFTSAGGMSANYIAKWDGSTWAALGSGMAVSPTSTVNVLTVFDDGGTPALYAGGRFASAGGVAVNHIAKWDGSTWAALGSGMVPTPLSRVRAFTVFDDGSGPALHAGGDFLSAIDSGDSHLARWGCAFTGAFETYCTAGTSAGGCIAQISASGVPSATASSGFTLATAGLAGQSAGLYFFGANGRQARPWGNGTSFQCVAPPMVRADMLAGSGTGGLCDGAFVQDFNALWSARPAKNPGVGAVVQAQLWYLDSASTSNQSSSLSDAIEFTVAP